ncbi:MAG: hypothetical protein ACOYVD_02680 [Bacillota bacterium]
MPDIITLGGYTINFLGAAAENNLQTWTYSVIKTGDPLPEVCSIILELCYNPLHNIHTSFGPGSITVGQGTPCLPYTGRSIKWEGLNNKIVDGVYSFTLKGSFKEEIRQIAVNTGLYCLRGYITGPGCIDKTKEPNGRNFDYYTKNKLDSSVAAMIDNLPIVNGSRGIKVF